MKLKWVFNSFQMKLKGFYWSGIQGFKITDASDEFKGKYPKDFILVCPNVKMVYNVDRIEDLPISFSEIKYMFTYTNMKGFVSYYFGDDPYGCDMNVMPMNLHHYFSNSQDCNVIMKLIPKQPKYTFPPKNSKSIDPRLIYSIVLRNNIDELKGVDFKKSFDSLLKSVFAKFSFTSTEQWLEYLLETFPVDADMRPYEFPNEISDSLFKKPLKVSMDKFVVGYVIREADLNKEMALISALEQQLNDPSTTVTIKQNYSNLLNRVIAQAKKQKLKYKQVEPNIITMKAQDFYKLKLKFTILDMITVI